MDFIPKEDSVCTPIVKLQRIKATEIQCPGCSESFYHEDHCAEHLILSCIKFSSNDEEESRRNFLKWIFDYFQTYLFGQQNPPNAVKIDSLLNNDDISRSVKARLLVTVPKLPVSIVCPVCSKLFSSAEECSEHLFHECSYSDTNNPSQLKLWLSQYFSEKKENNLIVLENLFAKHSSAECICKYCKQKIGIGEDLMDHFRKYHRETENFELAVCDVCNFSASSEQRLMTHMLVKHIRCVRSCDVKPKKEPADFSRFVHHIKTCDKNIKKSIQCPVCYQHMHVKSEWLFKDHILNCRKRSAESAFDVSSLYGKCDICLARGENGAILLSDIDSHLRWHLKRGDSPSHRQKRFRISLDKLNDHSNEDEQNFCHCNIRFS